MERMKERERGWRWGWTSASFSKPTQEKKKKKKKNSAIPDSRTKIEMMEDRISLLPDCLIVEIISRLVITEEAIRTCILSKRWKHLWTRVPTLDLFCDPFSKDDLIPKFISYIEKVMSQRGKLSLNKLSLYMPCDVRNDSIVRKLIRYAVDCNVQDLEVNLAGLHRWRIVYVLDEFFFINSRFTHLRLMKCSFDNATGIISWSNLKLLSIGSVKLDEDLLKNILSGSPLLEKLMLEQCFGFRRIDITSPSVKKLVVNGYGEHGYIADILEIYAPHILSLTIEYELMLSKVMLVNVSSLVRARLDYWMTGPSSLEEKEEMFKGLIVSLRRVKKFKIGPYFVKILARLEAKGFTYPSNMKYPDLSQYYTSDGYESDPKYN